MKQSTERKILGTVTPAEFIGREAQLARLFALAVSAESRSLAVLATPGAGTSELLRQTFDRLFHEQEAIVPFYFCLSPADNGPREAALRFARELVSQTVAFRRRDPAIIDASPEMHELAEIALPLDSFWIDRLVESFYSEANAVDERSFVRNILGCPLRAHARGAQIFVMIDGLHETASMAGGDAFFKELRDIYGRSGLPYVFAGARRFLFGSSLGESLKLEPLNFSAAGRLAVSIAAKSGVAMNDQARDLIAVQLGGNPSHISSLFAAAVSADVNLDSFRSIQRIYSDEIFGGRIGRFYEALLNRIVHVPAIASVVRLLAETLDAEGGKTPLEYWRRHLGLTGPQFRETVRLLNIHEIVNVSAGTIAAESANIALTDYVRSRSRLEAAGQTRAFVVGEAATEYFKRAPHLLARLYRRNSALGLRELLATFDCQEVAAAAIDYSKFKADLKGLDDDAIEAALQTSVDTIKLPQIVYTAHTAAFYSPLGKLIEDERSTIALGFEESNSSEETVWIAAEIDSKLEAPRDLAEFWCDRLEMVAVTCGFANYKLWLIAPEGFTDDACEMLQARGAFGSSRVQAEWLVRLLAGRDFVPALNAADEYEMIIPMGEDTEMIAAHAVEEIAKRRDFPQKAINQIKTALVEACINATEHSLSPDRRIYQKFAFDDKKVTVTVSNRGLRLADKTAREIAPAEGRRGWGLKLMRGLMDDVKIEQTDDGTRVTMVKYLTR